MHRLESGQCGIRWRTLSLEQKIEISRRVVHAMRAIGEYVMTQFQATGPIAGILDSNLAIIHGSFLWGAAGVQPGDIDVILEGFSKAQLAAEAVLGCSSKTLDVRFPEGGFTVGGECNELDQLVGIPLWGDAIDVSGKTAAQLWPSLRAQIDSLFEAASSEVDQTGHGGKCYRKAINIAVVLSYVAEKAKVDASGVTAFIATANKQLLAGRPNDKQMAASAEKCLHACGVLLAKLDAALSKAKKVPRAGRKQGGREADRDKKPPSGERDGDGKTEV